MAENAGVGGAEVPKKGLLCVWRAFLFFYLFIFFAVSVHRHGQMETDAVRCRPNGAEAKRKKEEKSKGNKEREKKKEMRKIDLQCLIIQFPRRLTSQLAAFSSSERSHAAGTCFKSQNFDTQRRNVVCISLHYGRSKKGYTAINPAPRMQSRGFCVPLKRICCHSRQTYGAGCV